MPVIVRVNGFTAQGGTILDLEIEYDANGYVMLCRSRDGSVDTETWHTAYNEAIQAAFEQFGVEPSRWESP